MISPMHEDEAFKPKKSIPNVKYGGGSIMSWRCFAGKETGALQKIHGIKRKEEDLEILKQHLLISSIKLKLGCNWFFQ